MLPSGQVSIEPYPGTTQAHYFMDAMLATEFLRWYDLTGNAQAYALAVRIMEFLLAEDARWQAQGYATLPYQPSSGGAAPDLAGYYVWPAMVLWQDTGDPKWYAFARRHMTALHQCWLGNFKQLNQCYSIGTQNFPALEAGVPWR
jgi:hypothetical protein